MDENHNVGRCCMLPGKFSFILLSYRYAYRYCTRARFICAFFCLTTSTHTCFPSFLILKATRTRARFICAFFCLTTSTRASLHFFCNHVHLRDFRKILLFFARLLRQHIYSAFCIQFSPRISLVKMCASHRIASYHISLCVTSHHNMYRISHT
jgi:hypothetical protein